MDILLKILDPDDTSTGGGSASALAGAMAGALVAMVARLSTDKEEDGGAFYTLISTQAEQLSQELLLGSREDAQAFQSVRGAYQLPHQTETEKAVRQKAVQSAWLEAARVPLENAERCFQIFELGSGLTGQVNANVLSDLNCAMLLARAGLLGCLENVHINLPAIKNQTAALQLAGQASALSNRLAALELNPPSDHISNDSQ